MDYSNAILLFSLSDDEGNDKDIDAPPPPPPALSPSPPTSMPSQENLSSMNISPLAPPSLEKLDYGSDDEHAAPLSTGPPPASSEPMPPPKEPQPLSPPVWKPSNKDKAVSVEEGAIDDSDVNESESDISVAGELASQSMQSNYTTDDEGLSQSVGINNEDLVSSDGEEVGEHSSISDDDDAENSGHERARALNSRHLESMEGADSHDLSFMDSVEEELGKNENEAHFT